jgi:hypothetical protein
MPACPTCGEENPERARFCWSCGAAIAEAPRSGAEERKIVSVLFVDLVGFTAASEKADPEDVRARLRPYHVSRAREARDRAFRRDGGKVRRCLFGAGRSLLALGRPHEATARLQEARTLYQDLGAAPSLGRVDEALAHATSVSA